MAPKQQKFADGEKVLCFHGPLIYEAKCLKHQISKEKHVKYFIHYAGWNKNWDEWVPESRVLKYNEVNVQKQREVQKAHSSQPPKPKKTPAKTRKSESGVCMTPSKGSPVVEAPASTGAKEKEPESRASTPQADTVSQDSGSEQTRKKRGRQDSSIESEEQFQNKVEVKIKIPEELKMWLVDDWDIITRQQKLAHLPAKLTVFQVLDNYMAQKRNSKTHTPSKDVVLLDVTQGIKEYFNACLGSQLLYKFERPQYSEILLNYPDTPMSKIYGSIHLLRLFVKIGPMMAYTSMDEKALQHVQVHFQDLLKYMSANRGTLFNLLDYENATSEYNRKSLTP